MKLFVVFMMSLLTVTLYSGCGTGKATMLVDNDSKESLQVEVKGHRSLYVGPDRNAKLQLPFGEHHVTVLQKNKVIFEDTKTFEPYEGGPGWRHYLLDPQGDTIYAVREFYYYKDAEQAKSGKSSRRVRALPRKHWVDVPKGATALTVMPIVLTSTKDEKTSCLAVVRDE